MSRSKFIRFEGKPKIVKPVTFQISTDRSGRRRTFKVFVYDTAQDLQAAANKYDRKYHADDTEVGDALGIVHKHERITMQPNGTELSHNVIGTIRLTKNHLKTGILTHEVAHAALWVYDCDVNGKLPTDDIEQEEIFCHVLGDLCSKLIRKLYAKDLIPSKK